MRAATWHGARKRGRATQNTRDTPKWVSKNEYKRK